MKGDPLEFFNILSVTKHQKIENPLKKKLREKSLTVPKNMKGGPFSLARYCMLLA